MKAFLRYNILIILLLCGSAFPVTTAFAQNKKIINPAISLPPKSPQKPKKKVSKDNLARSYYYKGDFEKAAMLYGELYKKNPGYGYYIFLYNSLIKIKEYKKVEKICKKQIKTGSFNYRYKIDLAYVYTLEGEKKKANKILDKIITNLPENKNAITNLAAVLQSRGFFDKAIYVYRVAKENKIDNYDFNMELATAYRYTGNYEDMFDVLINHLEIRPRDISRVENNIQNLLVMDVDDNLSKLFKLKILTKAQQDPSNPVFAELLMWYSLQIKDFELALRQAKSIEKRFRDQEGKILDVADVAYSNGNYKIAAQACEYLLKKKKDNPYYAETYEKYFKARLKIVEESPELINNETWKELDKIGQTALNELGFNGSSQIVKELAYIKAFKLNRVDDAISLLNKGLDRISASKGRAVLKLEKADILAFIGKFWDASLLYAQVENSMKNEPLGFEAKYRNARLFYYKGEFTWAKTRLDVLKGSTSKFIANDALELSLFIKEMLEVDTLGFTLRMFAAADQYAFRQKNDSALMFLNKIEEGSSLPLFEENVLFKKGLVYENLKEYNKADSVYTQLFENFPESIKADNAIYRAAEINRLFLNNIEQAQQLYLKLMKDYPESIYSTEARKLYRKSEAENNGST